MSDSFVQICRFASFRLEVWPNHPQQRNRLRLFDEADHDKRISLEERDLEVLEILAESSWGTLVEKRLIARKVFGSADASDSVYHSILSIRDAIKDHPPRIILNERSKGYKVAVPITSDRRAVQNPALWRAGSLREFDDEQLREAFDEFFGIPSLQHEGIIVVQSDLVDLVLPDSRPRRPYALSTNRLYKARTFVNTYDLRGALHLQDEFEKHSRPAPKLLVSEHTQGTASYASAPFKVSLGLGFTDETTRTLESWMYNSWMSISKVGGDALSLREDLFPAARTPRLASQVDPQRRANKRSGTPGFRRLLPRDWNKHYIAKWCRMLPPTNGPDVRDYAIILRSTRSEMRRHVHIVAAGFTERSTEIAAIYLVKHWKQLWENYVRGKAFSTSYGDFLIVIEGPSDPKQLGEWSQVPEFDFTPDRLEILRANRH